MHGRRCSRFAAILALHIIMSRQFATVLGLVERAVERREEEHDDLRAHTYEHHQIGTRQVSQLEQCAENYYRSTPAIGIVEERLSGNAVHPLLQMVNYIVFAVNCHSLMFCLTIPFYFFTFLLFYFFTLLSFSIFTLHPLLGA